LKFTVATLFFLVGFRQICGGQTNGTLNSPSSVEAAPAPLNGYTVLGATPQQETLIRSQIQTIEPVVLPLRIVFVPHWKYVENTRIFHLHVPAGYTSALFTHLPSRTVFIDSDRYVSDDSLGYWLAHELGHLAANSAGESDADKAAREYRKRLKDAKKKGPTLRRYR
jgi:hypothetical protein